MGVSVASGVSLGGIVGGATPSPCRVLVNKEGGVSFPLGMPAGGVVSATTTGNDVTGVF